MARYELIAGTSRKFWQAEVDGKKLTVRWGRIGTDGQSKTKAFASPAAASKEHASLVAEKTKKGYRLAKAAAPAKKAAKTKITKEPSDVAGWLVYADAILEG